MSVKIILGAQWGDEGKGKIVDLLSEKVDIVARYQGGPNAGHTVVVNKKEIILHQIPSGILWPQTRCVIGNSVVIDPNVLMQEVKFINSLGVNVNSRLWISDRAHLILPYHRILDSVSEKSHGSKKIGTTGRGIGPAYVDKYARIGIRVADLLDESVLEQRLSHAMNTHNRVLEQVYNQEKLDINETKDILNKFTNFIKDSILDTSVYLAKAISQGKEILIEGAQGTMLDIDYGTYPFVTSSNPIAGGACVGLGIGPNKIDKIIGIVKAYTTRVGMGPFPTEFDEEFSDKVRNLGNEFGATTGRPRRCGWFDAVVVNHAVRVNGLTSLAITKLDVLDSLDEIKICTGYKYMGQVLKDYPASLSAQQNAEPIYEVCSGWKASTSHLKQWSDLPIKAQDYLNRLSELTGVPIEIVSVGPGREQTIFL